jgi:hypothetical protein
MGQRLPKIPKQEANTRKVNTEKADAAKKESVKMEGDLRLGK